MRLLITGSSGQVGTNLALRCLEEGHEVVGLDRRPNPWTDRIPTLSVDLTVSAPDPAEVRLPQGLPWARPDVVVHLAAHAKVHETVRSPALAYGNIAMTQIVLDWCRAWAVPIVFASSREVYGDVARAATAEDGADFHAAASPYSASKLAGEAMVYAYARCYGLSYAVFRFSNVFGRYDNDLARMERVVPLFIARIEAGLPVTVYGSEKILDFTYVDDCVEGLVRGIGALARGGAFRETINLAFGEGHSLVELARFVGEAVGRTPDIVTAPVRAGEIGRYVADLGRARRLLGFEPRVPLDEGVACAVAWSRA